MTLTCLTCGESFKRPPSTVKRGGKYCSRKCYTKVGSSNPKWRGGRIVDKREGRTMVYAPNHPNATMMGGTHIYEYRLVASQMLGRPLRDDEIVHHKNNDPSDNRPDNLEVITQSEHMKIHWDDMFQGRKVKRGY